MTAAIAAARQRIAASIDAHADKASAEIRAMAQRDRRSLGQRIRWIHFELVRGAR